MRVKYSKLNAVKRRVLDKTQQTKQKGNIMIKLNNKFKMTKSEIEQYNLLPDNLPDNKLTKKQIEFVNDLYYNYITLNIDNKINGYELFIGDNREFTKNWYLQKIF